MMTFRQEMTSAFDLCASMYQEHLAEHVDVCVSFVVAWVPPHARDRLAEDAQRAVSFFGTVRERLAEDVGSIVSFFGRRKDHAVGVVARSEMHEHLPYPLDTPGWIVALFS
jgi:hypothetical protein